VESLGHKQRYFKEKAKLICLQRLSHEVPGLATAADLQSVIARSPVQGDDEAIQLDRHGAPGAPRDDRRFECTPLLQWLRSLARPAPSMEGEVAAE
jgi:hypothetical protein